MHQSRAWVVPALTMAGTGAGEIINSEAAPEKRGNPGAATVTNSQYVIAKY